jgi:cytochrome c-type biogenesis protein
MTPVLNPALAFVAGAFTILSPCVLPLVPIVMGSAAQKHRWGPIALSASLVGSFTLAGLGLAASGSGSESTTLRVVGATLLLLSGLVLILGRLQAGLGSVMAPVAAWAGRRSEALDRFGLAGQAAIGAMLGLVWSPCVGPTLGAASVLAAQGRDLAAAGVVMAAFAIGIMAALLMLALGARTIFWRRSTVHKASENGKVILGAVLAGVAVPTLTGADHLLEAVLVNIAPDWLTDLTTRF